MEKIITALNRKDQSRGDSDINPYALTGDAEFFAVVSEYFFQQPQLIAENHPEIYQMLGEFFKQK